VVKVEVLKLKASRCGRKIEDRSRFIQKSLMNIATYKTESLTLTRSYASNHPRSLQDRKPDDMAEVLPAA
jgi:hypothetical protein